MVVALRFDGLFRGSAAQHHAVIHRGITAVGCEVPELADTEHEQGQPRPFHREHEQGTGHHPALDPQNPQGRTDGGTDDRHQAAPSPGVQPEAGEQPQRRGQQETGHSRLQHPASNLRPHPTSSPLRGPRGCPR
jgi:hypothetical protein